MAITARTDELLIEELDDEAVVYDRRDHTVHHLTAPALAVWTHCDGHHDLDDLARALPELDQREIAAAVVQLDEAGLITISAESAERGLTRRKLLQLATLSATVGVGAPLIRSIAAPTPAMAASPPTTTTTTRTETSITTPTALPTTSTEPTTTAPTTTATTEASTTTTGQPT